jgi:hypothetical protein
MIQAKRDGRSVELIYFVDKLGELYLEKKDFAQAAKIFNCELALLEMESVNMRETDFYRTLVAKVESIEMLYLASVSQSPNLDEVSNNPSKNKEYIVDCRAELARIRQACFALFRESEYVRLVQEHDESVPPTTTRNPNSDAQAIRNDSVTFDSSVPLDDDETNTTTSTTTAISMIQSIESAKSTTIGLDSTPLSSFSHADADADVIVAGEDPVVAKFREAKQSLMAHLTETSKQAQTLLNYMRHHDGWGQKTSFGSMNTCLFCSFRFSFFFSLFCLRFPFDCVGSGVKDIQQILVILTDSYRGLLERLIRDALLLLGTPPTEWYLVVMRWCSLYISFLAFCFHVVFILSFCLCVGFLSFFLSFFSHLTSRACVGMGSMSRDEMCPFSDLEFAFLLRDCSEVSLRYFRTLARVVELKIINLGETYLPLFFPIYCDETAAESSPTPRGFAMDTGGTNGSVFFFFFECCRFSEMQETRRWERQASLS